MVSSLLIAILHFAQVFTVVPQHRRTALLRSLKTTPLVLGIEGT
jgi:hypothetical protein